MIRLLTKAKLHYSIFLINFNLFEPSLKVLYEALAFSQKELNMRIHKWNPELNFNKKNKNRMNQTLKIMILILFYIGACHYSLRNIMKFVESIALAFEISKKYQIDELMRWLAKIYTNILQQVFIKKNIVFIFKNFRIKNIFLNSVRLNPALLFFSKMMMISKEC